MNLSDIKLDGQTYKLAREKRVQETLGPTARTWQMRRVPIATKREPRENVRRGEIDGEWVITYDDWSKGVTGSHNPLPGTVHIAHDVDPTVSGSLRTVGAYRAYTQSNVPGGYPVAVLTFAGLVFSFIGRYVYKSSGPTSVQDKDFGDGVYATDATIHNNYIVVGFGGSTNKVQYRDTAGNWTPATDAVYADYFAPVEDRLWRATATNEVGNIGPTDSPLTLANWSTGITVGDDDVPITDLNGQDERVIVSKEDGLYLGDIGAVFPNRLSHMISVRDADNGVNTLVRGSQIFYPHRHGLVLYESGSAREVGIATQLTSVVLTDTEVPGHRITAMTPQGEFLWAVTEPSFRPFADPTGFQKTVNSGTAHTDYTSSMVDQTHSTKAILDSLDTVANGDWIIVGYSAPFYGVLFEITAPNGTTATIATHYWNGGWTAMTAYNYLPYDGTAVSGVTLARSGVIAWEGTPGDWVTSTINDIEAYWVRFSVSAAIDAEVEIGEARIVTTEPLTHFYRGRSRRQDDVHSGPIIWEPMFASNIASKTTAMTVVGSGHKPYMTSGALVYANPLYIIYQPLAYGSLNLGHDALSEGYIIQPKDDAGMPQINKQFLDFTLKGRTIDSSHTVDLKHRCDETAAWTSDEANIATTPNTTTLSEITGRSIQLYTNMDTPATEYPTEIHEIEVRFRELPTYKNEYTAVLEVGEGQSGSKGGQLPAPKVQLTNLQGDQGAGTLTLKDPLGEEVSVTVEDVQVLEKFQEALESPFLLVQLKLVEV